MFKVNNKDTRTVELGSFPPFGLNAEEYGSEKTPH